MNLEELEVVGTRGDSVHLALWRVTITLCGYAVADRRSDPIDKATCRVCRKRAGLPRRQP